MNVLVADGLDILASLRARGLELRLSGDEPRIGPALLLDECVRELIAGHRGEIIAALAWEQALCALEEPA